MDNGSGVFAGHTEQELGIVRLSHVGFAVPDIDEFQRTWGTALGMSRWVVRDIDQPGGALQLRGTVVGRSFSRIAFGRLADTAIELVEPRRGETRTSAWLTERGPGIHHLAFWVADLDRALRSLGDCVDVTYSPVDVGPASTTVRGEGVPPTTPSFWAYTEHRDAGVPWCLELLDARRAASVRADFGDHIVYPDTQVFHSDTT